MMPVRCGLRMLLLGSWLLSGSPVAAGEKPRLLAATLDAMAEALAEKMD